MTIDDRTKIDYDTNQLKQCPAPNSSLALPGYFQKNQDLFLFLKTMIWMTSVYTISESNLIGCFVEWDYVWSCVAVRLFAELIQLFFALLFKLF